MHSEYTLRLPPGLAPEQEEEYRRLYAEHQVDERARRRQMRISSLPLRLQAEIENARETEAVKAARDFMASRETFAIIAGGVGTGKSVAAALALVDFDCPPGGSLYTKATEYVSHGMFGEENTAFWAAVRDVSFLVIDDLGTETRDGKGFASSQLEALLDHRYDALAKTLMTTNLADAVFKQTYCQGSGARLLDRLRESGGFYRIPGG